MQKKCLVVVVIVTLLAWTWAAMATPLILDNYEVLTEARNDDGEYESDYNLQSYPISAYSITAAQDAKAEATSETNKLFATALTDYHGSYGSSATAKMEAWKDQITISADLTKLHITFTYQLKAEVDRRATTSGLTGYAKVSLHPSLKNITTGLIVWEMTDSLLIDRPSDDLVKYETGDLIDEVINLEIGHQYAINFYPLEVNTWSHNNVIAKASGEIMNLELNLVPLPSTLLLASSGLLGLLALRRKRKF